MAIVNLTVGATGQYLDLVAAWDAIPADVVASGNEYVIQFQEGEAVYSSQVTLAGKTTSASNCISLTAVPGGSFLDNPDLLTTPLAYDPANGAALRFSSNGGIAVNNAHVKIFGLQFKGVATTYAGNFISFTSAAIGCLFSRNLADSAGTGTASRVLVADGPVVLQNSVAVYRSSNVNTGTTPVVANHANCVIDGLTIVRPSGYTGDKAAVRVLKTDAVVQNCIAINCTTFASAAHAGGNNACTGSVLYGTDNLPDLVATDVLVNPDTDFRTKSTSPTVSAGRTPVGPDTLTLSGSRVQGAAVDIGAWEQVTAADRLALTGPATTFIGYLAGFTVTANGALAVDTTVTPSAAEGGVVFSPTSMVIAAGENTASFNATAMTAGTKTITLSSNPALIMPAAHTLEASQKPPSGVVVDQSAPDGQTLTILFNTSDSPTEATASMDPDPSNPAGAVATSGTVSLIGESGEASWTDIQPGNYIPVITLVNSGGSGTVSGLQPVSIIAVEGSPEGTGGTGDADTEVPVQTGTVSTSNVTYNSFTVSWPAGTDNVGVVAYELSLDGGTSYANVGNVLTFEVTGRTSSTLHDLRVRALDASGNKSVPISGTVTTAAPPADTTAPVMSGSISVSNVNQTGYTLSWTAATDDIELASYELSTDGGTSYTDIGNVLTYTESNATANTQYQLRIRAVDSSDNKSDPITGTVTTASVPVTAPDAPTIGTAVAGDGYVDVYFTPPANNGGTAITKYVATLSTNETAEGTTSPIRVMASNGTARTASVRAVNSAGTSAASAASNAVTPTAAVVVDPDAFTPSAARTIVVGAVNRDFVAPVAGFWDMTNPKKPRGKKDPDSIIDITFDWSEVLADVQSTIDTIQFILGGGPTSGEPIVVGSKATVFLAINPVGSNDPKVMSITCRMTTASNPSRSEDRTVFIDIEEQ